MELRHILLLLSALLVEEAAKADKAENIRFYCGKELSDALSVACKGNYNTLHKKSSVYSRRSYWESRYTPDDAASDASYPYISKNTASSLITRFRRRIKRGVYNECCEKPCSFEELMSYCA